MLTGRLRKSLLFLTVILGIAAGMTLTAHASANLMILSKSPGNYDVCSYDAATNTLTLKDGELQGLYLDYPVIWYSGTQTLNIALAGHTVVEQKYGFDRTAISIVSGNAVISGEGSLEVYGNGLAGITCAGDLYINSGRVYASGGDSAFLDSYGIMCEGSVIVNGGWLVADADKSALNNSYGIYCGKDMIIAGGTVDAYADQTTSIAQSSGRGYSYGICAEGKTVIQSGVDSFVAMGYTKAISGAVVNQLHGLGWETIDESDPPAAHLEGTYDNLPYKKLQIPVVVDVNGVVLNKTSMTLSAGSSQMLTATVNPWYADNIGVVWSSDNERAAAVDSTGKVTAVAGGRATITVRTMDGGYTADCAVTVSSDGHESSNGSGSTGGGSNGSGVSGNSDSRPTWAGSVFVPGTETDRSERTDGSGSGGTEGNSANTSNTGSQPGTASQSGTAAGYMSPFIRIKSVWHTKSDLKISWDAVTGAEGYDVFAAYEGISLPDKQVSSSSMTYVVLKKVYGRSGLTNINKNMIHYLVRAYKTVNGQKQYIAMSPSGYTVGPKHKSYSDAKKIVVKKTQYLLNAGQSVKIDVKVKTRDGRKQLSQSSHAARQSRFYNHFRKL